VVVVAWEVRGGENEDVSLTVGLLSLCTAGEKQRCHGSVKTGRQLRVTVLGRRATMYSTDKTERMTPARLHPLVDSCLR
jgi:hypothetical protein